MLWEGAVTRQSHVSHTSPHGFGALFLKLREIDVEHFGQAQQLRVVGFAIGPGQPRLKQLIGYTRTTDRDIETESRHCDESLIQKSAVVDCVDDASRVVQLDSRTMPVSASGPPL